MSAPSLPPEILATILSFLDRPERLRCVTVSRKWQLLIERSIFRNIELKSTDLQEFSDIFVGHRRGFLAKLSYDVILPGYDDRQRVRFEREKDKQANDEALTEAIHGLFSVLASSDEAMGHETVACERGPRISLGLAVYPFKDVDAPTEENESWEESCYDSSDWEERQSLRLRYKHSILRILRLGELPEVTQISEFEYLWGRSIDGASLAGVVAKLPNLETLLWGIDDSEYRYPAVRQQHRFDFAQSLQHINLLNLRHVRLYISTCSPRNHHLKLQSALLPSSPSVDHLSCALHVLSQLPRLVEFVLRGSAALSPCFFWPDALSSENLPFWPNLQYLHLWLSDVTPDGRWLYLSDANEAHEDESIGPDFLAQPAHDSEDSQIFNEALELQVDGDEPSQFFRKVLDHERIKPMLMAMARAATRMPKLQRMELGTGNNRRELRVTYLAPGQDVNLNWDEGKAVDWSPEWTKDLLKKRWHILLCPHTNWEVPYELECIWKEMGSLDDEVVILIDKGSYRPTKL